MELKLLINSGHINTKFVTAPKNFPLILNHEIGELLTIVERDI